MKRQSSGQLDADCSVAWQLQNGRSRIQRSMAADGYKGDYPYAGVTVVAENRNPEDNSSALIVVETVRDVFAEGVAFGVEDALRDSMVEAADLIRDKNLSGCSAAAIAVSGTHIWYAIAGNCRIYRIDSDGVDCIVRDQSVADQVGMSADHPDYHKKIRDLRWWLGGAETGKPVCGHARIKQDTTYVILTAGGWIQLENSAVVLHRKGTNKTLAGWLSSVSREMKLAYRRQGGAIGAVSGLKTKSGSAISWKAWVSVASFLGLIGFLVFANPFSSGGEIEEKTDLFSADTIEEIVQPILTDSGPGNDTPAGSGMLGFVPDSLLFTGEAPVEDVIPDLTADLPLQIAQVGGAVPLLDPDSFAVSLNTEPDLQWENYAPGIYSIRGDTASAFLAEVISSAYPGLEIIQLNRIITVRENGVAESARWLSSLSSEMADSTGVVVETRSSVAGGAEWIRNYPVFVNGNRSDRAGEAGGFMGDSLPGLPSLRNPRCYRLVIVL
ncbi:MAG: protein phosphatase 2C family protein [Candidatus Sabulitectum sp.]|nr:protein phosphatase 2C family protein [Candidatus Sabulitectum sp.]